MSGLSIPDNRDKLVPLFLSRVDNPDKLRRVWVNSPGLFLMNSDCPPRITETNMFHLLCPGWTVWTTLVLSRIFCSLSRLSIPDRELMTHVESNLSEVYTPDVLTFVRVYGPGQVFTYLVYLLQTVEIRTYSKV